MFLLQGQSDASNHDESHDIKDVDGSGSSPGLHTEEPGLVVTV